MTVLVDVLIGWGGLNALILLLLLAGFSRRRHGLDVRAISERVAVVADRAAWVRHHEPE
jgi:hypothetical protein